MFGFTKQLSYDEIQINLTKVEVITSDIRTQIVGILNSKFKIAEQNFFESSLLIIEKKIESLEPFIISEKKIFDKIRSDSRNLLILSKTIRNRFENLKKNWNDKSNVEFDRDTQTFKTLCVNILDLVQEIKLREVSYLENLKSKNEDNFKNLNNTKVA